MTSQLSFSIVDPYLYLDPHALLREMRTRCPVFFDEKLDSWLVTRYDDVVACLKDPRMYVVEECKRIDALSSSQQAELVLQSRFHCEFPLVADE